jgi:hypothetical protein
LEEIEHVARLAHRNERGHALDSYQLVYELFTLLWDSGAMDAHFARKNQAEANRPDLPSLLADTAARQFRSPTAIIQAETAQTQNAQASGKAGDHGRPGSFCPDVAEAILSSVKPL